MPNAGAAMAIQNTISRIASITAGLLFAVAVMLVAGCSKDDTTLGSVGGNFTEGLAFTLQVRGAWSSNPEDPAGRTQGTIRVSVAGRSQLFLGSETMTHVGETPDDELYQTAVHFGDLPDGVVVVRIVFQHQDTETNQQVVTTLKEISTIDGKPIEIAAERVTDIGTVEVTIPQT